MPDQLARGGRGVIAVCNLLAIKTADKEALITRGFLLDQIKPALAKHDPPPQDRLVRAVCLRSFHPEK